MIRPDVKALIEDEGVTGASKKCNVAGILFTYRCTIACKHCLFGCSGDRPDVVMTARQCADALAMLHETGRVVHIAGGEAMLYWPVLAESIRLAHKEGVAPHFIETNCSFATSDDIVRERLGFMANNGVCGLYTSADVYHQQFVPADRFLRVRRLAKDIFGERNFFGHDGSEDEVRSLERISRSEAELRDHVRKYPPMMIGTACTELSQYLDGRSPDDLESAWDHACRVQFCGDTMWELHIDPYGNIQTNCGIILGNVADITPAQLLAAGPENVNRFVQAVCHGGPFELARLAEREYGFAVPAQVSQPCHLCYLTRRELRRHHPDIFGPAEVYA